jgi:SAM-dependent methyltransferase
MSDFSKVSFLSDPAPFREKEKTYLEVRRREGRVFPDEVVRALPFVSKSNAYAKEWAWRRRSFHRFLSCCKHLSALRGENVEWTDSDRMTILDLGCGNGWLANRLAENPDWDVWAVDVNEEELAQGARLFGRENLRFAYADFVSRNAVPGGSLPGTAFRDTFDLVVLAASVQYFPDLENLISSLKKCLKPGGEIHILDSPFYKNEEARKTAKWRTVEYYTQLGVPEMAAFYHHHLWADVEKLGGVDLNNRLEIKFLQKIKWLAPFPWAVVRTFKSAESL